MFERANLWNCQLDIRKILFTFDSAIHKKVYRLFDVTLRRLGAEGREKKKSEKMLSEHKVVAHERAMRHCGSETDNAHCFS